METILGIRGPDFVMVAEDTTQARSIIVMKEDENKIHKIADNLMMATIGDYDLNPKCAAHFTRKNLADYLRSRTPNQVNMFVAGYDPKERPELHYIDYLANAKPVKYSGQGYGGMFCASIFDCYYNDHLTQEEAYDVLKKCVVEIQKRLVITLPKFKVG
ncbi:hypothetical protein DOY81_008171 [Sarcophaga bullata]|nr:hypothetical protein DOY81_008171 [Sarcophaga bullata]